MRKVSLLVIPLIVFFSTGSYAGLFDTIKQGVGLSPKQGLDNDTIISGLKEALSIGS
jgi:hypothetical protein